MERVMSLASQRAVAIFSISSCDMCHAIKRLFCEMGCNAAVHELDEEPMGQEMRRCLVKLLGRVNPFPAVFIGGKLVGSTDHVFSLHLARELVPLLREARALWL